MKSWRSRIAAGLVVGAAAIAIPLTATSAVASPPPGSGWHVAGGMTYDSKGQCEAEELSNAQHNGYDEVWCDGPGGRAEYTVWVR
ncbi:hypothetical protein VT50_0202035 [Streptomyces antioxidans]|uniref:Secreted protein n=1 Tax=Streptomyces antioxidans TaxID=1507734 RepID=A0A1V4DCS9_9ACTN|nr:hypothetical protein [Streptomyces antioxidans]OPF84274.1 hypothetical protein VT50_0202035 [Streptomyces antioxidans]